MIIVIEVAYITTNIAANIEIKYSNSISAISLLVITTSNFVLKC